MQIGKRENFYEYREDKVYTCQYRRKINDKEFRFTYSINYATGKFGHLVSVRDSQGWTRVHFLHA